MWAWALGLWPFLEPDPQSAAELQLSPADPETIYASEREYGTRNDRIHVSRDGGATWTSHAGPGEIVSMAPDRRAPRTIYVSVRDPLDEGTVFRSTNEGGNWTPISENLPADYTRLALSLDGTVLHATTLTGGMWELFLTKPRQRAVEHAIRGGRRRKHAAENTEEAKTSVVSR